MFCSRRAVDSFFFFSSFPTLLHLHFCRQIDLDVPSSLKMPSTTTTTTTTTTTAEERDSLHYDQTLTTTTTTTTTTVKWV